MTETFHDPLPKDPAMPPDVVTPVAEDHAADPASGDAYAALRAAPWLQTVPAGTLEKLAALAMMHRLPAGSLLFEQAETPAFAQFLIGGSVELLGVRGETETLIELVRPVDLLLPAAVLNRQPYLMRARVLDEASLLLVQADGFRRAVIEAPDLCLAVLACQAAHFRRLVKQAKNVRLRSAEERVGCYLVRLAEGMSSGDRVRLPMEKRLIATELGMTRETFSRTLPLMARHGLRVDGDIVAIEDAGAARLRFGLDPLIDGGEAILPLSTQRT
jgi:CRP/FNR family transcriptional activator FtrB